MSKKNKGMNSGRGTGPKMNSVHSSLRTAEIKSLYETSLDVFKNLSPIVERLIQTYGDLKTSDLSSTEKKNIEKFQEVVWETQEGELTSLWKAAGFPFNILSDMHKLSSAWWMEKTEPTVTSENRARFEKLKQEGKTLLLDQLKDLLGLDKKLITLIKSQGPEYELLEDHKDSLARTRIMRSRVSPDEFDSAAADIGISIEDIDWLLNYQ